MDYTVKKSDIDSLATKLDEFSQVLTDNERALLLYAFTLVGKDIAKQKPATPPPAAPSTMPKLSDAFESAFSPGPAGSVVQTEGVEVHGGGDVHVSVKF